MFNRLRLKLTLVNLFIAVLIFVIVFTGVYFTMYNSIISQSEQLMNILTYSIASGGKPQDPKMLGLLGNHAFLIADLTLSGKITDYRSTPLMPEPTIELVNELVTRTIQQNGSTSIRLKSLYAINPFGIKSSVMILQPRPIQAGDGTTYLSRLIKKADDSFSMIFINIDYENSLLKSLRSNLITVALAGLGLIFAASLFLSGKAVKPIKAAWEKQKSFVADASHELRTPLAVMQTNLELVMENKLETIESQTEWLENIYAENKHMTKLVSDLLLLARADSDQKLMEIKSFSLSAVVAEAANSFVPVARDKGVNIDLVIKPDINFLGDQSRLKQLVVILIDNAVKYTPSGGSVSLSLESSRDNIEIVVTDTGEGIASENLKKIFERFYRVDKARSNETAGVGLGLAIASWIVKEHHGTINADSTLGNGTTFKVVFPKSTKQRKSCISR